MWKCERHHSFLQHSCESVIFSDSDAKYKIFILSDYLIGLVAERMLGAKFIYACGGQSCDN